MDRDTDLDAVWRVVAQSRWRFAKTYVESYPPEYTGLTWAGSDSAAFAHAIECIERWGVVGVVELTALIGYYTMVAMTLNAYEHPLPAGVEPPFAPLPAH